VTENFNRTFLAIDYGSRRIGIAKSDPMGIIASALDTITVSSLPDAVEKVLRIISEYQPNALVVGYPLHESSEKSEKCTEVDAFIGRLSAVFSGPIYKTDEFNSSQEAAKVIQAHGKKTGDHKARIDSLAAAIILQRFLEEHPS
jgi:putative Holliday junction resolvase